MDKKVTKEVIAKKLYLILRVAMLLSVICLFIPAINPARVSGLVNKNLSLFTSGTSYSALTGDFGRALRKGWVEESNLRLLFISSMVACLSIVGIAVAGCMSIGSLKFQKLSTFISSISSAIGISSFIGILVAAKGFENTIKVTKVEPMFPVGYYIVVGILIAVFVFSVLIHFLLPRPDEKAKYVIESKYQLFLLFMPFIALSFVFSYLPLWGWRYSFFDYKSGGTLSADTFVGFKWFTYLFENEATRTDIIRVLKNTLAMSGLGLSTSWCAMAFAIFLSEIKNLKVRRFVQTFTTIPNFISWVLVYAVGFAIFSTDGFVSSVLTNMGVLDTNINFLMDGNHTWLKMLAWGMWKGLGWSAIIYIAAISGIDQQLYEAATVDGAGRFQRMWNITVPGLMPTFYVLLLLAVAGILNNGMDQYFVFENANNAQFIQVLDLYVYKLGINKGIIPLSTVIGMAKSVVSVTLLFGANRISKMARGESIV